MAAYEEIKENRFKWLQYQNIGEDVYLTPVTQQKLFHLGIKSLTTQTTSPHIQMDNIKLFWRVFFAFINFFCCFVFRQENKSKKD